MNDTQPDTNVADTTNRDLDQIWKSVRGELELVISAGSFGSWISPCFISSISPLTEDRVLVELATPAPFHRNQIDERYYGQIKTALEKQLEQKCELALVIKQRARVESEAPLPPSSLFNQSPVSTENLREVIAQSGLNPKFNLNNFVVGTSNDLAYAAAKGIVDNPGTKHNPLFIWGGVGVGKTHLMHAIGRALIEKGLKKVKVITSEQFTNELIATIRSRGADDFKKRYREADALLIDDIQFFANRDSSQEEFFHTFNHLYGKQKQIIMTSDRRPQDIQQVEQRLISRFLGGLTVDIALPDYEMRCAILRQTAEALAVNVDPAAIETMAKNVNTNARELEGIFTGLVNMASLKGSPLTQELVELQLNLKSAITKPARRLRAQEVISTVAKHFNLKNKELCGHNRKADLVRARQIAMYFLREDIGLQLQRVAQLMGGRDHTTVIYGVEKMKREFELNSEVRQEILALRTQLFG